MGGVEKYRTQLAGEYTLPEGALDVLVPNGDLPSVGSPKTRWECHNSKCTATDVTIEERWPGKGPRAAKTPACPLCGEPLWYDCHLERQTLVPYQDGDPRPETFPEYLQSLKANRPATGESADLPRVE